MDRQHPKGRHRGPPAPLEKGRRDQAERAGEGQQVRPAGISGTRREAADWTAERSGEGCVMINAHAEISDPAHPAYPVIIGQKRWMLELFRRLADDAGAGDPESVAGDLMLLHEGALVTAGMWVISDPFATGRTAALARLASA